MHNLSQCCPCSTIVFFFFLFLRSNKFHPLVAQGVGGGSGMREESGYYIFSTGSINEKYTELQLTFLKALPSF